MAIAALALLQAAACSSSGGTSDGGTASGGMCSDGSGGGPVTAPAGAPKDTHCIDSSGNTIKTAVSAAACHEMPDASASDNGDAGAAVEETVARYGTEAFDDDCKYDVTWSSTCIAKNEDITFTVIQKTTVDDKPVSGSAPYIEAWLTSDETHLQPDTPQKPKEVSSGKYTIGPIRFDKSGDWTVKFHFSATCVDLVDDSPHGHVAFHVNVP